MNCPVEDLKGAISAVSWPNGHFAWLGELQDPCPASIPAELQGDHLRYQVTLRLYVDFYLPGRPVRPSPSLYARETTFSREEVREFSQANLGSGQIQDDWRIVVEDACTLGIKRGSGPTFWVASDEVVRLDGAKVRLTAPKEMVRYFPGFYCAMGNTSFGWKEAPRVRVYWNIRPGAAPSFLRSATRYLNDLGCAFIIKTAYADAARDRCDNVLVVVERQSAPSIKALRDLYEAHHHDLRSPTPALTKRLASGLAVAEDPADGESFGWHRCGLIAAALVEAVNGSSDSKFDCVSGAFRSAGISISEPWGSVGSFEGLLAGKDIKRLKQRRQKFDSLATAERIGQTLAGDAVWSGDLCSWIGTDPLDIRALEAPASSSLLAADLYDGTAGIALFLAELSAQTGDVRIRNCAVAALRYAMVYVSRFECTSNCGLYQGPVSVAVAAAKVGALLASDELRDRSLCICKGAAENSSTGSSIDLLRGRAGLVLAFVLMAESLAEPSLLDLARDTADELIEQYQGSNSWPSPNNLLTGLAHGTSGIAHALLELYVATGEARWYQSARQILDLEAASFDADRGQWRDLRPRPDTFEHRFATAWCHGTPGMAVPRIRALELASDSRQEKELQRALAATQNAIAAGARSVRANFSLCHGLLGNLEIVFEARRLLGGSICPELAELETLVEETSDIYASDIRGWPCGGGDGYSPSLMLGLSGIGLFYLRLSEPSIPSIVVPRYTKYDSGAKEPGLS